MISFSEGLRLRLLAPSQIAFEDATTAGFNSETVRLRHHMFGKSIHNHC